jgi:hypothetical protein
MVRSRALLSTPTRGSHAACRRSSRADSPAPTRASASASRAPLATRASSPSGEATPPMSSGTSPLRPSTSPSRTTTSPSSRSRRTTGTGDGLVATSPRAAPRVPPRSSSSTRSTTPVPASPTTPSRPLRAEASASSMASSTSTARRSPRTALAASTVASSPPSSVLSSTVVSSAWRNFFILTCLTRLIDDRNSFGVYDSLKPVVLVGALKGSFLASFMLGWGVTIGAGLASYPLDTIRSVCLSSVKLDH